MDGAQSMSAQNQTEKHSGLDQSDQDASSLGSLRGSDEEAVLLPESSPSADSSYGEFVSFHEDYTRHYIALADAKATVVFGVAVGLLAYLYSNADFLQMVLHPTLSWRGVLPVLCSILLGLSAISSALVILPRLGASEKRGIVFFGDVAGYASADEYLKAVRRFTSDELVSARLRHAYDTAKVCKRKYIVLRWAIYLCFLGVATSLPILGKI